MKRRTRTYPLLPGVTTPLLLFGLFAVASGCSEAVTAPEPSVAVAIELVQPTVRLTSLGEQMPLQARVVDARGREVSGVRLSWVPTDPAVVEVTGTDALVAKGNGVTVVRVQVVNPEGGPTQTGYLSGAVQAELEVTVFQEIAQLQVLSGPLIFWALGESRTLEAQPVDARGNPVERAVDVIWEADASDVVEVSSTGLVVARDDGLSQVRALAEGRVGSVIAEVRSGFEALACVSSSASRVGQRFGPSAVSGTSCAGVMLRAVEAGFPGA